MIDLTQVVEPTNIEIGLTTIDQNRAKRQQYFSAEADPLYFQWQAGEATKEEWLEKRQQIRDAFPYPSLDS